MAAIRIQIKDSFDNPAVYAQLPVEIECEGPIEIVGPHIVTAEGGMCGTYIRTTGKSGNAKVKLHIAGLEDQEISFLVEGEIR